MYQQDRYEEGEGRSSKVYASNLSYIVGRNEISVPRMT